MAPRLSKSGIEYLNFAWNFFSGCDNQGKYCQVPFCWAEKITERFEDHYPDGFLPHFYPEAFLSPLSLHKPSRIGVAFMGDLFGDSINPNMQFDVEVSQPGRYDIRFDGKRVKFNFDGIGLRDIIFKVCTECPRHTFIFLTKCQHNLPKWGKFPDNCHVGFSSTGGGMAIPNFVQMAEADKPDGYSDKPDGYYIRLRPKFGYIYQYQARVKFISFEPLLYPLTPFTLYRMGEAMQAGHLHWLIIGALTGTKKELESVAGNYPSLTLMPFGNKWSLQPPIQAVKDIVKVADQNKCPVFLKNNLKPLLINKYGEGNVSPGVLIERVMENGTYRLRQELPG